MSTTVNQIRTAAQIRQDFLDFFVERCGHTFAPSSSVVPFDDPTLLFTNAGMNQFKDVFLGQGDRPYHRAVNTQKCIRAGGKHNDLEDVGRDAYHHTFFEMLGNWSFGDYFKAEAIEWAWTLLTEVWGIDKERLHVTVFAGDEADGLEADTEAEEIWKRFVPAERISRWDRKDNFWEMGETGPCGPCSEIHYDATPDMSGAALVNKDHDDVIEIWNLVFIQYNRIEGGKLNALPARHVDTGMGLERIVRVLQGKNSNYATDLWTPIFDAIRDASGAVPYGNRMDDPVDTAYRIIADHIRCLTIAITDGARPSSDGRGYVMRRILRRAVRHAHQTLGAQGPLLARLVPAVVDTLGDAFPLLRKNPDEVAAIIRDEELGFLRTIERGLLHFNEAAGGTETIAADDAFKLHDTFGFPIDLTRVMAEERGLAVDETGFTRLMEEARERSRGGSKADTSMHFPPDAIARVRRLTVEPTIDDVKHLGAPITATLHAIWNDHDFDETTTEGKRLALIVDRTNMYAEAGGQIGDVGSIRTDDAEFRVHDVQRFGDYILHIGEMYKGRLDVGASVHVVIDRKHRDPVRANHTSTHLLNHALRQVLGEDIDQRGSLVAPDRLRFDFTCSRAITPGELNGIERLVNSSIHRNLEVFTEDAPLEMAMSVNGVRAVFGERYPDPVRVVSIGVPIEKLMGDTDNPHWPEFSVEFCGGTHLGHTGAARKFEIVQEGALAAGIRRITALTGAPALAAHRAGQELESRVFRAKQLDGEALVEEFDEVSNLVDSMTISVVSKFKVRSLLDELRERVKAMRKGAKKNARDLVVEQARVLAENIHGRVIVDEILGGDKETLRSAVDVMKAKRPDAAVCFLSGDDEAGKVAIIARVPDELIKSGLKAGDWVREVAKVCGGGGGGRPDMAQAGGKDPSKIAEAVSAAKSFAESALADG